MKKVVFLLAAGVILAVLLAGCTMAAGAEVQTIAVSNALEFLKALGSDRIIEMDYTGDYNLSGLHNAAQLAEGVSWSSVYDGTELVLSGIKNLTIRGGGEEGAKAHIIVDPRYAFVMKFENCSDIVLDEIKAGHSEGGYCEGGVFSFADSSRITLNWVTMYGCGTEGLALSNVSGMKVTDSSIYDCTYYIMSVSEGENIAFNDCMFMDNKQFTLVNVTGTKNMTFTKCAFNDNQGQMFDVRDTTISVSNSSFNRNDTDYPIQDSSNVKFAGCRFD